MSILSNSAVILGLDDIVKETVSVPEWKCEVLVKSISAAERDEFEQQIVEMRQAGKKAQVSFNRTNIRARLVVKAVVNEQGERVFSDAQSDALGQKNAAAIDRIYAVASRLAGISKEDEEELGKNFVTTPSSDSPSA